MLKSFQMRSEESGVCIISPNAHPSWLSGARRDSEHPALWPASLRTGPEPQVLIDGMYRAGKCWERRWGRWASRGNYSP